MIRVLILILMSTALSGCGPAIVSAAKDHAYISVAAPVFKTLSLEFRLGMTTTTIGTIRGYRYEVVDNGADATVTYFVIKDGDDQFGPESWTMPAGQLNALRREIERITLVNSPMILDATSRLLTIWEASGASRVVDLGPALTGTPVAANGDLITILIQSPPVDQSLNGNEQFAFQGPPSYSQSLSPVAAPVTSDGHAD